AWMLSKARSAEWEAARRGGAVAGDVTADLAPRALDGCVHLPLGNLEPLGEDLEVVDQGLHRFVDSGTRWRCHLLVLDPVVAAGHPVEDLTNDLHALAHLVEADRVAIERVAVRPDDHVEVHLRIVEIGHVTTQVPCGAGAAQDRATGAYGTSLLCVDDAAALQPLTPDRLAGHQRVVFLETRRYQVEQLQDVVAPTRRQTGGDTARADEVVVHPPAGDLLEEAQHLFARAPAVDHHRHRADVHAVGREEQQVAAHPVELAEQHAHPDGGVGDVAVDADDARGR